MKQQKHSNHAGREGGKALCWCTWVHQMNGEESIVMPGAGNLLHVAALLLKAPILQPVTCLG